MLRQSLQARGRLESGARAALHTARRQADALQNAALRQRSDTEQAAETARERAAALETQGEQAEAAKQRAALQAADARSAALLAEYTDLRLKTERAYAALWDGIPALETRAEDIAAARRAPPLGTLYLAFSSAEKDTVLLALAGGGGEPQGYPLGIERRHLAERVKALRHLCRASDPDRAAAYRPGPDEVWAGTRRLFRALFPAQVREQIRLAKRLVISPDGPLWDAPFAVLVTNDGGEPAFLGAQKPLVYSHSLILYTEGLKAPGGRPAGEAFVVGNPWFGAEEAPRASGPCFPGTQRFRGSSSSPRRRRGKWRCCSGPRRSPGRRRANRCFGAAGRRRRSSTWPRTATRTGGSPQTEACFWRR